VYPTVEWAMADFDRGVSLSAGLDVVATGKPQATQSVRPRRLNGDQSGALVSEKRADHGGMVD